MQLKKITLACAAALAVSPAFAAFDPADAAGATKIVLSGATAPDGFLASATTEMLKTGYKTYRNNDTTQAFQYRAWFGAAKAGITGVPEDTPILVIKRSKGGSVIGVDPVARANRIEALDVSVASCAAGGVVTVGTSIEGTYDYLCGVKGLEPDNANFAIPGAFPNNDGLVSDFGVSDVNPKMFKGEYNVEYNQFELPDQSDVATAGGGGLDALTIKPVNSIMMGIVATNDVPATTRISRADYANMLAGKVQTWTKVDPSLGGNTQVVVCRRVNGSGTQSSYNWFFNNFPCQSAFAGTLAPASQNTDSAGAYFGGGDGSSDLAGVPIEIDPTQGYTVVNNSTSGDVRNCLIKAQAHQDHTIKSDDGLYYTVKFSNSVNPFKAIGVLSVDSYNSSGTGTNGEGGSWTFRHLDGAGTYAPGTNASSIGATGIAPSKDNLINGYYDFAVELTMQYRNKDLINKQGDAVAQLSSSPVKLAFVDELIKRSGDPVKIAANSKHKAYAALPDAYNRTTATEIAHVAKGSHNGNMCKPLVRKF